MSCGHLVRAIGYSCDTGLLYFPLFSDPPFAPQNLRVIDYNSDYITVAWDKPDHDGGSPVQKYVVEKRDALRSTWAQAGRTEADVTTLKV